LASVFWFNAFSFIVVAIVLGRLNLEVDHRHSPINKGQGTMKEAIAYIKGHPIFLRIFAQFVLVQVIVFPILFTTLRVLVQERFKLSDRDFGFVFAMPGAGALIGSVTFLILNPKNPLRVLPISICGIVIFVAAIAEAQSLWFMVLCLTLFSIMMFLTLSALLVTVQIRVEDRYRGRVSALIGMAFTSLSPIMAFPMGLLSDYLGGRRLLWSASILFGLASGYLALTAKSKIEKAALS
jgi:predicted MFS family arabinose efflux permease